MYADTNIMQQTIFKGIILFREQIFMCIARGQYHQQKNSCVTARSTSNNDGGDNLVCVIPGSVHSGRGPPAFVLVARGRHQLQEVGVVLSSIYMSVYKSEPVLFSPFCSVCFS
jgi:hypothetical protein